MNYRLLTATCCEYYLECSIGLEITILNIYIVSISRMKVYTIFPMVEIAVKNIHQIKGCCTPADYSISGRSIKSDESTIDYLELIWGIAAAGSQYNSASMRMMNINPV